MEEGRQKGLLGIGCFTAGAVLAATAVGAAVALLGSALPRPSTPAALVAIAVSGILMALADGRGRTPTLRRQTRPRWWRTHGPLKAAFMWGFDLGLGFTTVRVASLYWVVLLAVLLLASPVTGALVLGVYGLALGINLCYGLFLLDRSACGATANIRALDLSLRVKPALAVALVLWSAFLGVRGLAG